MWLGFLPDDRLGMLVPVAAVIFESISYAGIKSPGPSH